MRRGRSALAVALIVLSSTTAAACSGGDEPTEPAAQTATPTASGDLFDWVKLEDETSPVSAALPEGAEPIANSIEGPDSATITSRGHVYEHPGGVIGFELIDGFATVDDFRKLAELLARSVGGTVRSTAPVDLAQASAVDGEIVYGDDEIMLFRVVVLNERGDVWNGFVGGPVADRDRLESEFARLTLSLDLRDALDWVPITDEPSGVVVPFRTAVGPRGLTVTLLDGSTAVGRSYYDLGSRHGLIVIDTVTDSSSIDDAIALRSGDQYSTLRSIEPSEVAGREAVEALVDRRGWTWVNRVVLLDEHIVVIYSGNVAQDLVGVRDFVATVSDAVVLP
ncbi:hypothetical protein [Jiangella mangrovi]|uniref:Uncharacterized protein n=1 Tax=Jiangella mangrovi TaxID=1524084 RepID=A0A7W9GQ88_9ACTN|nr:hypothetical protein [Jiangella mangrovi]MBB5788044.1 hypothetical protein [Jiangella mangrovi]